MCKYHLSNLFTFARHDRITWNLYFITVNLWIHWLNIDRKILCVHVNITYWALDFFEKNYAIALCFRFTLMNISIICSIQDAVLWKILQLPLLSRWERRPSFRSKDFNGINLHQMRYKTKSTSWMWELRCSIRKGNKRTILLILTCSYKY